MSRCEVFFQLVNFLSCPLLSTDLVFSSLRKSATAKGLCRRLTTYIYRVEKQLAALCPQLRRLPAGNGMHESFIRGGEPLSVISDLEICMHTQIHRKYKEAAKDSTFLAGGCKHIYTHQGGLAFNAAIIQPEDKRGECICASILLLKMGLKKSQSHLIMLHVFILCSSSLIITLTV